MKRISPSDLLSGRKVLRVTTSDDRPVNIGPLFRFTSVQEEELLILSREVAHLLGDASVHPIGYRVIVVQDVIRMFSVTQAALRNAARIQRGE